MHVPEKKVFEKFQDPEAQRKSSLRGSLQTQREKLQPKKSAWSVGSKGVSKSSMKEPWKEWKSLQEKKNNQEALRKSDTSKGGIVHASRIVVIVSNRSWASVTSSHDEGEVLSRHGGTSLTKRKC